MIQLWLIPESQEESAAYQKFKAEAGKRLRIYGGPPDQTETIPARTIVDIAHLNAGESINKPGRSLVYITAGEGSSTDETLTEGDLVETRDFKYKAQTDSKLIIAYEL